MSETDDILDEVLAVIDKAFAEEKARSEKIEIGAGIVSEVNKQFSEKMDEFIFNSARDTEYKYARMDSSACLEEVGKDGELIFNTTLNLFLTDEYDPTFQFDLLYDLEPIRAYIKHSGVRNYEEMKQNVAGMVEFLKKWMESHEREQ